MVEQVSNLVEILERSVAQYGHRRLFGTKRGGKYEWITYGDFGALVAKVRGGLAALGVGRGDRVAIICDNSVEWAAVAYATYGLGAQFVPMYENQATKDWTYILRDSGAKVAITAHKTICDQLHPLIDTLETLERVIDIEGEGEDSWAGLLEAGVAAPKASAKPGPEEVAGLIYTSGTTGDPKGVILTHGNFAHNINGVLALFGVRESDSSLSFLPWAHSFGQTCELHCMIASGASMGLAESEASLLTNLKEVRPTLIIAVPQIFNMIYGGVRKRVAGEGRVGQALFHRAMENADRRRRLADKGKELWVVERAHRLFDRLVFSKIRERFGGRLRYAFSGGAALSKEVAVFIDNLGIMVYEGYGLSETSPIVTANTPGHRKLGSVGKPLPGVEVKITPAPHIKTEGVGEIVVYGPNVMTGYHNLPEETALAFTEDGGFRTGDLGVLDEDGYLTITGRVKEQYKLESGKYVVPAPLEALLRLSPSIHQIMLHGDNRPYNVALIVPDFGALEGWMRDHGKSGKPSELLNDPDLRKHLKVELARFGESFRGYEHPRKFRLLTEGFSTENDMLTPKMSLRRHNILAAHGHLIEAMYVRDAT